MAVRIRLKREGVRNHPFYKIVVADQRSPRDGGCRAIIGRYDPKKEGDNFEVDLSLAEYWLSVGAQPTQTVRSLIQKARQRSATAA